MLLTYERKHLGPSGPNVLSSSVLLIEEKIPPGRGRKKLTIVLCFIDKRKKRKRRKV